MILYQYRIFLVKNLQYWNNFLYQYCQQYWYTSIVIAKYRRSNQKNNSKCLQVGKMLHKMGGEVRPVGRTSSTCARCGRVYLLRTFLNEHISLHLGYEHDFVMYTLYTT